jgi:hypothetical protein
MAGRLARLSFRSRSTPGFFDRNPQFGETSQAGPIERLKWRYKAIVEPHRELIRGSSILDIGSHDGRWSFAALDAGAARTCGIEPRADLVGTSRETARMLGFSDRTTFLNDGALHALEQLHEYGTRFDGVLLLGFFYHLWEHVELVKRIAATGARWVIVDTAVLPDRLTVAEAGPVVQMRLDPVEDPRMQAIADVGTNAVVGYPSRSAVTFLFASFGFEVAEIDWSTILATGGDTSVVSDYGNGQRSTWVCNR